MKVLIVEDEMPAAKRLEKLITQLDETIEIVMHTDSIEASVNYLKTNPALDLIFLDIQLADGLSFDIFEQVEAQTPVIFTTAFDQYTLKAFKLHSVDYLLKPIDQLELNAALTKFSAHYKPQQSNNLLTQMSNLLNSVKQQKHQERLLIKRGQQYSYIKVENTAYCYADGKLCYAVDFEKNRHLLDCNLSQLEEQLPASTFFRINRHVIVNVNAIAKVHTWLGSRLKVDLTPNTVIETIVSRERVQGFKDWLGYS